MVANGFPLATWKHSVVNTKFTQKQLCRLVAQPAFALMVAPVTRIRLAPLAHTLDFLVSLPVVLILGLRPPTGLSPSLARFFARGLGAEPLPVLGSWVSYEPFLAVETFPSTLSAFRLFGLGKGIWRQTPFGRKFCIILFNSFFVLALHTPELKQALPIVSLDGWYSTPQASTVAPVKHGR